MSKAPLADERRRRLARTFSPVTGGHADWMEMNSAAVAATYFDAWNSGDFDRLRSILADDVSFVGSMGLADGVEDCLVGLQRMAKIKTDIVVRKMWVDGDDVLTWFDIHTADADPMPVANQSHVTAGKIDRIRVTFDPRPIAPPGR